jgi:RNase P subunit RPR2
MKLKISKIELVQEVKKFFSEIKNKSPKEVKKIKKVVMKQNIPLKGNRRLFCKYCLNPFSGNEKIRIKNKIKNVECLNCKKISRWKIG